MVWAFVVGLSFGFPTGVYLREKGYTGRMRVAYNTLLPNNSNLDVDNYGRLSGEKKRDQYYKDLKAGLVSNKDFERYIFGGKKDRKYSDERDLYEDKLMEKKRQFERETNDRID